MADPSLAIVTILSAVSIAVAIEYIRLLRRAQKEYLKAKNSVDDIVLSFNRQLKREAEEIERVGRGLDVATARADRTLDKVSEFEKELASIGTVAKVLPGEREGLVSRLEEIEKKSLDAKATLEALHVKVSGIEELVQHFSPTPEPNVEAAIPIRRDKALAQLTETELSALEFLATEGAKTAPEMKARIKLSREHTARLMKKLYEEGYLERDTGKIPFKYSVKKEMEKFLRKTENQSA